MLHLRVQRRSDQERLDRYRHRAVKLKLPLRRLPIRWCSQVATTRIAPESDCGNRSKRHPSAPGLRETRSDSARGGHRFNSRRISEANFVDLAITGRVIGANAWERSRQKLHRRTEGHTLLNRENLLDQLRATFLAGQSWCTPSSASTPSKFRTRKRMVRARYVARSGMPQEIGRYLEVELRARLAIPPGVSHGTGFVVRIFPQATGPEPATERCHCRPNRRSATMIQEAEQVSQVLVGAM